MAGQEFPVNISRRRLLASAVSLPAASIVPIGKPAGAAAAGGTRSFAIAPEAEAANVCSVTATRLAEIARRNALRNEFGLPLVSVATELRRMKTAADTEKFEGFSCCPKGPGLPKNAGSGAETTGRNGLETKRILRTLAVQPRSENAVVGDCSFGGP